MRRKNIAPLKALGFLVAGFAILLAGSAAGAAGPSKPAGPEERRRARLISHLKRLNRAEHWLLARKFFSRNRARQLKALGNCPPAENEWPWYLSSPHLENYTFTVEFLPVNMDGDPEEETLIVLRSDPNEVSYITFCLLDDAQRGRAPIASYSDLSRDHPPTFQLTDLTADGASELIIHTREGKPAQFVDTARVMKPGRNRHFELVWFGRLRDQLAWPAIEIEGQKGSTIARSEKWQAKLGLQFNGSANPLTIVLKGEREYTETLSRFNGERRISQTSSQRIPFEERWRWDKKRFYFVRHPLFP